MKRANKIEAGVAVILGDNELDQGQATVKNLGSGEQTSVALDKLADALDAYR
jgi:histidyl-tRNA synthetase